MLFLQAIPMCLCLTNVSNSTTAGASLITTAGPGNGIYLQVFPIPVFTMIILNLINRCLHCSGRLKLTQPSGILFRRSD